VGTTKATRGGGVASSDRASGLPVRKAEQCADAESLRAAREPEPAPAEVAAAPLAQRARTRGGVESARRQHLAQEREGM
jgi:hypothetical protein